MSIYSNIDLETFKWVKGEVDVTLEHAKRELERFTSSDDKEALLGLVNQLHQVVGSLQMLELKSLSSLILESERLIESFTAEGSTIGKASLVVLLDKSFEALESTFGRIESGLPENPTDVVELINQIRNVRGREEIEISSLFSPMIDIFPEVDSQKALRDDVYARRAKALRSYYQSFMLQWLRDEDDESVSKIRVVFDKLLDMSTFSSVARLWWVATAYADYIQHNDIAKKLIHSRILRQLDDLCRKLEMTGESALVQDPGEELIKLMLFYVGVGEKRTERMDEIVSAFSLEEYFPALKTSTREFDEEQVQAELEKLKAKGELPLPLIRQLVTSYFEVPQEDNSGLDDVIEQLQIVRDAAAGYELGVFSKVLDESVETTKGIRNGLIQRDEDSGFHLASALIFVENTVNAAGDAIDENWFNNGNLKLRALRALNNQEEITADMDGTNLTGGERKALLNVVGAEVEENLKMIEENLEEFAQAPTERLLLAGIDGKVRQVRGALQVLGEQKIGLLLKLAEEQFAGLESDELAATPQLLEALAISVGTMEEYVKGLKINRQGMDVMLDRSITDLEVAIGKKVSRDDVEDLIDNASDSLFTWLSTQADFDLFTNLKSSLRDLNVLAKKTNLRDVELLVGEQNRLVDVISQEPAFLTDNIKSNLQNNMAVIAEQIIQLYGTEDTAEELQSDADLQYRKSAIESSDEDPNAVRIHDDMDISAFDEGVIDAADTRSVTEIGKQNAVDEHEGVDEAILEVFIEESEEVLEAANEQFLVCIKDNNDREAIRELRRAFHTLKGSARMVELNNAGEVAWLSESMFNYVLDTEKPLNPSILEFARDALDTFKIQVEQRYAQQQEIDVEEWTAKSKAVSLDGTIVELADDLETPSASDDTVSLDATSTDSQNATAVTNDNANADESDAVNREDLETNVEFPDFSQSASDETQEPFIEFNDAELDAEGVAETDVEQVHHHSTLQEQPAESVSEATEAGDVSAQNDYVPLSADWLAGVGADPVEPHEVNVDFAQGDDETDYDSAEITVDIDVIGVEGEEIDTDTTASFSVIDDPQMRDVFAHEAENNLLKIREELKANPLVVVPDDVLSISIHTLLGNARTLELSDIAHAYEAAEHFCLSRQISKTPISEVEKQILSDLVEETQKCVVGRQDTEPYFEIDSNAWLSIKTQLENAESITQFDVAMNDDLGASFTESDSMFSEDADIESFSVEDVELDTGFDARESLGFMAVDDDSEQDHAEFSFSELSDYDKDAEIEVDIEADLMESMESESTDASDQPTDMDQLNQQDSSQRVAAVFDELDSVDDLLADGEQASPEPSAALLDVDTAEEQDEQGQDAKDDDLAQLESSLSAFNNEHDQVDTREENDIEPHSVSLIPDDLTDLLQEDILSDPQVADIGAKRSSVQDSQGADDLLSMDDVLAEPELNDLLAQVEELQPGEPTIDAASIDDVPEDSAVVDETIDSDVITPESSDVDDDDIEEPSVIDDEEDELDRELRGIYVTEMRELQTQLDDDVARLSSLASTPDAMKDILHHLHTIKGSSLMAEANVMGELTHHTESYLEGNFIRSEDDLREIRVTLERYIDAFDRSTEAYNTKKEFTVPQDLSVRLGISSGQEVDTDQLRAEAEQELQAPALDEAILDTPDSLEQITLVTSEIEGIFADWKSARGWKKIQPKMLEQFASVQNIVAQDPLLEPVAPLVTSAGEYIAELKLRKTVDFENAKELLQETYDVAASNVDKLLKRQTTDNFNHLLKQLESAQESGLDVTADEVKTDKALATKKVSASKFVPGSSQVSQSEREDLKRQNKGARDRAAALRIDTNTLDSLTNFVGDASMSRSQMREDVLSIKSVVENLYNNVQNFNTQLRELEIEADSKITARSKEAREAEYGEEFDPLELDRYTKLQQLSRGLAENLDELGGIQNALNNFVHKAETSLQKQERLNRELQDEIMQVRLVTFGGVGPQLRQVVRRTAREVGKDVELKVLGADVRLDKTILDGVVPALEHMLRNAVDHGIELPKDRVKAKKDKVGKITVECRQVAREIVISVRDDGVGLDLEKIKLKAIADKLLAPDQPLNPADMMMYISQSGFSTASELTQISGRGVGMDVVQTALRRMSGSILYDIENDDPGSLFIIRLPLSLAVTSAMFVEAGGEQFAVPARTIERVVNVEIEELIGYLKADKPRIEIDGQSYALIDLADYLGYNSQISTLSGKLSVILVNAGVQNIAVIIENLLDTQEIVVKSLGEHLGRIPIYSGATIRANGLVVLLLDLVGISYYESFVAIPEQNISVAQKIPMVMVVDDSLTVRKSAERDITSLGINSTLAKDGLDAQVQLRQEKPDMILLDIEMPRMDGFELLEWIRSEDDLKDVPVVMISSRATEKYIDKANQLGCSAFLGKPYLLDSLVETFNEFLDLEAPLMLDKN